MSAINSNGLFEGIEAPYQLRFARYFGTSQFLLVNVDFVLAGKRGLLTAGASTLLLVVTWWCVASAYSYFVKFESSN